MNSIDRALSSLIQSPQNQKSDVEPVECWDWSSVEGDRYSTTPTHKKRMDIFKTARRNHYFQNQHEETKLFTQKGQLSSDCNNGFPCHERYAMLRPCEKPST
jgi:hypothetical protein